MITDLEGTIEFVNPAFTRVTGYTPREVLRKTPQILHSGGHPPNFTKTSGIRSEGVKSGKANLSTKKNGDLFWGVRQYFAG